MRKLLSLSMSAALLASAGAAFAAPASPDQGRSEVVAVSDLNLVTSAGADAAIGRLSRAADRVCATGASSRDLTAWTDYQSCRRHAMDASVTDLRAPLVSARYFKRPVIPTSLLASR